MIEKYIQKIGKILSKPLVCADFRPHPHAHRTHFRSVRRTHPHPSFCARTRTCTHTRTFFLKIFLYLKIEKNMLKKFFFGFFFKKKGADVRAHVRTLKVIYARTRTHISENFAAPFCTKIAAHYCPLLYCTLKGPLSFPKSIIFSLYAPFSSH